MTDPDWQYARLEAVGMQTLIHSLPTRGDDNDFDFKWMLHVSSDLAIGVTPRYCPRLFKRNFEHVSS